MWLRLCGAKIFLSGLGHGGACPLKSKEMFDHHIFWDVVAMSPLAGRLITCVPWSVSHMIARS